MNISAPGTVTLHSPRLGPARAHLGSAGNEPCIEPSPTEEAASLGLRAAALGTSVRAGRVLESYDPLGPGDGRGASGPPERDGSSGWSGPREFTAWLAEVMAGLGQRRPVFHSKRDLQHELAIELEGIGTDYARVEPPLRVGEERSTLDIVTTSRDGHREMVGYTLRYLTRRLSWADPATQEEYALRDSSGQERLAFLLDIGLLERAVRQGELGAGVALLLSNDASLWHPGGLRRRDAWMLELLSMLRDGGRLSLPKLQAQSSDGFWWGLRIGGPALAATWDASIRRDPAARQRGFEAFQRLPYVFAREYPVRWQPYSELGVGNASFRYLAITIE